MAAEFGDLPDVVKTEVLKFCDINVAWLAQLVTEAGLASAEKREARASSIYAAIARAQIIARSRSDVSIYDALIDGYRAAGLLPGASPNPRSQWRGKRTSRTSAMGQNPP